jgi:tetratricopeptide (TPR) repeat protein
MAEFTDQWLWFVDEELVDRLMAPDEVAPTASIRPAEAAAAGVALGLHMQGRTEEAAIEVERALELGEPGSDLFGIAGNLHFQLGDFAKAAGHFAKLRSLVPDHPTAGFNLGVCYERLGKYEQAIEAFTTAASRHNQLWQAHVGLGYCHLRLGRYNRALQAFQDSLELQPGSEKALFGMAVALQFLGRLDEAEDVYVRLLPQYSENVEMLANLVVLAATRKDDKSLFECSRHLFQVQPNSRIALEGLLTTAFTDKDFNEARHYALKLTEVAPQDYRSWYNLGFANQKLDLWEDAAQAYREALRVDPKAAQAHTNLGTLLHDKGDYAGAKASYEEALTLRPAPDRLWNLALVCEQLGEPEEAELAYEQMVEIRKDWAEAWFRLATIRFDRGDFGRALQAFESAAEAKLGWPEALIDVGVCRYKLGEFRNAEQAFEQALAVVPKDPSALTGVAASAVAQGDATKALEYYRELQATSGGTAELAFNVGLVLQQAGENTAAVECYQNALTYRRQFPEALVNLGHAMQATGHPEEARRYWSEAMDMAPELASAYFPE